MSRHGPHQPASRLRPLLVLAALVCLVIATQALAKGATVKVGDNFFSPRSLGLSKGTTVRWNWTGKNPHNVTVTTGPQRFHSSTRKHGSFSHKFTAKGSYTIVCTIHGKMIMHVMVR
jgi:plastocyanin